MQKDIEESVEYRLGEKLSEIVDKDELVFLSGSSVFWLNAFFDIKQARGGNDKASVDPNWRKAVWEIRAGSSADSGLKWLKKLGVGWLVVHTKESKEYYKDFKYPDNFEDNKKLKKIYEGEGERLYKVNE